MIVKTAGSRGVDSNKMERIVIIDKDKEAVKEILPQFEGQGFCVCHFDNAYSAIAFLRKHHAHIVMCETHPSDMKVFTLLDELKYVNRQIAFVLAVTDPDLSFVVEAVKKGVFDCIMKPYKMEEVKAIIKKISFGRSRIITEMEQSKLAKLEAQQLEPENRKVHGRGKIVVSDLKYAAMLSEYEKVLEVLNQVNYNKSKAARVLNIDRKTLYNKMKAFSQIAHKANS